MKIVIFGATGSTGRQLVAQALELGHDVTAFARNPEKVDQKHERLQVIKGNVLDPPSVEQAIQGQGAVLCSLGLPPWNKSNVRANGTKNIIRAMEKSGVKRLICQSSYGVGDSRDRLPFLMKYIIIPIMLRRAFEDHEMQENHIKESRLDWVIVRPVTLTDGEHTGSYQHGRAFNHRQVTFKISRADTADFMLKQLTDDSCLRKTPSISY
ncbi:MAG: SDR family oxidoreductase [Desulfovibrio sp.]|nr:MAG: SDR family oxidoreductase [Desulfovibrio sp.]